MNRTSKNHARKVARERKRKAKKNSGYHAKKNRTSYNLTAAQAKVAAMIASEPYVNITYQEDRD